LLAERRGSCYAERLSHRTSTTELSEPLFDPGGAGLACGLSCRPERPPV